MELKGKNGIAFCVFGDTGQCLFIFIFIYILVKNAKHILSEFDREREREGRNEKKPRVPAAQNDFQNVALFAFILKERI